MAVALKADKVEGSVMSGIATREDMLPLRPLMIDVNMMIDSLRAHAKRDSTESWSAMESLLDLLRNKLGLDYSISRKVHPSDNSRASP